MNVDILEPEFTVLSSMARSRFDEALDKHVDWGMKWVDLKDAIYGKSVTELSQQEAERAAKQLNKRKLNVECLSSTLFGRDVSMGEAAFRQASLDRLPQLIETAKILGPRLIRILCPHCSAAEFGNRVEAVDHQAPWLWDLMREAVDIIWDAGFTCTIENEIDATIIDTPEAALAVFERIDRDSKVWLTWDVQNMWEVGTFPTIDVYEKLKPFLGYYHIKGGRSETPGGPLRWRSSLADASWPVREITDSVIADNVSPVICINPPHGESVDGVYVDYTEADVAWTRETFQKVASNGHVIDN